MSIPFASQAQIIGGPEVKAFSITVVFKCACTPKRVLMIQGGLGAGVVCQCNRTWTIGGAMLSPEGAGGVSLQQSVLAGKEIEL